MSEQHLPSACSGAVQSQWDHIRGLGGSAHSGTEHVVLSSALELLILDFTLGAPVSRSFSIDQAPLVFSFHLSGCGCAHVTHSLATRHTIHGRPNEVVVTFSPESGCRTELEACQHYRVLNIYAHPQRLHEKLAGMLDQVPHDLRNVLDGRNARPYTATSCITPETRLILEQIHTCPYKGGMKQLLLEHKTMELIFRQLYECRGVVRGKGISQLRPGDVERLHEARRILLGDIVDPPSLSELSRRVGINTAKLKTGFRQVFGTTVFGLLREERLVRSRRLLLEGRLNITEIGQDLGFSDASHFIREFSKRYGTTPGRFARKTN